MQTVKFNPPDLDFESRIRTSFDQQQAMKTLMARLIKVCPGEVQIHLPFDQRLTQQHGYVHAGIVTAVMDTACGYAAYTLMPKDSDVLTVEYKANFLFPAKGETFLATGKVVKPGRTLTVCTGELVASGNGESKVIAVMQATMITVTK